MKIFTSLLLFLVLASAGLKASAQTPVPSTQPMPTPPPDVQPADETDVVRVTTNLIQIDATVTDDKGRAVTNLKPEDFEIFVNGKPQQITNFSFVTVEPQPDTQPVADLKSVGKNAPPVPFVRLLPEQVNRTIALVVDDLSIGCEDMPYVRRALKKFVDEQMQPGDLVAIVRAGSGVGALQQFTSNKQQLYAAIARVIYNPASCKCEPGCGGSTELDLIKEVNIEDKERDIKKNDDDALVRHNVFANAALSATRYVIQGMRGLPGRKAVLLFSEGFILFNRDLPEYNTRIRLAVEHLVDSAIRAGAVIYTMDARGLVDKGLTGADGIEGLSNRMKNFQAPREGLVYLAKQAGGFAIYDTNDIGGAIRKALDDQKSYYLIGYQPDATIFDPTQSRFNHLTVKVKGSGLNVRYRSGFYGIKDDDPKALAPTSQQQIMQVLTSPFASSSISLRLTPIVGNEARAGSFVRALVHVPAKDLTFTAKPDGSHVAVINVVAYTFNDDGRVVDSVGETHTLTLPDKVYQRALTSGLVYSLNVPIKNAGAYQLRVAVRDDKSQRVGSASQFIQVPDVRKNRLTLSGIALSSYDPHEEKNITNEAEKQLTVETAGNTFLTQSALRRFRSGHVLQFAYHIYNARLDKTTNQPQLTTQLKLFHNGKEIYAGKEIAYDAKAQPDLKRLVAEGALQLGGLKEGEYVLQLVVTDNLAEEKYRTTTSWIDFEVVK
jgi:VWFA-related protein